MKQLLMEFMLLVINFLSLTGLINGSIKVDREKRDEFYDFECDFDGVTSFHNGKGGCECNNNSPTFYGDADTRTRCYGDDFISKR